MSEPVSIGERRVTSAGKVYVLRRIDGPYRYVERVAVPAGANRWDEGIIYRWHECQWEEGIPLENGDTSGFPHFGVFAPRV